MKSMSMSVTGLVFAALAALPTVASANGAAAAAVSTQANQMAGKARAAMAAGQVHAANMPSADTKFGFLVLPLADAGDIRPYIGKKWDDINFSRRVKIPRRLVAISPDKDIPYFEVCQIIMRDLIAVCDSPDGNPISLTQLVRQNPRLNTAQVLGVGVNLHDSTVLVNYVIQ